MGDFGEDLGAFESPVLRLTGKPEDYRDHGSPPGPASCPAVVNA
jgi:hypothetical protein